MSLPPLAIYVHVPWCVRKCPYCDFNSHAASAAEIPEAEFLAQLKLDLAQDTQLAQGRKAHSVFFGGGTPSLLSERAVSEIMNALRQQVGLTDDAEITLEANPGTAEAKKFAGYAQAGVNRLSIGVQSFKAEHLKRLGRIHNGDEAMRAAEYAHRAGISNFNIDLMHGLPDQSEQQALEDIEQALRLAPRHISWYQLTIEANTEFYRQPPPLPADDTLWAIQHSGQQLLAERGYQQYEVSAYAQAGQRSQHNLNYWQYGDYLGIGPGAHGKYTQQTESGLSIIRTRKTRLPKDYLRSDRLLVRHEESVAAEDRAFDYFINTLRLRQSTTLSHFEATTGLASTHIQRTINELVARGWMQQQGEEISTTEQGYLYLNDVLSYWLD